jgi:hypothetical protein
MALLTHPSTGVVVPIVPGVWQLTECGFDVVPAPLVLESASDQFRNECAAASGPNALIQLCDHVIVKRYVQTHVLMLAHRCVRIASTHRGDSGVGIPSRLVSPSRPGPTLQSESASKLGLRCVKRLEPGGLGVGSVMLARSPL